MTLVYARDGSAEFNTRLHQSLLNLADDVERAMGKNLLALLLGGGYGRGEGGVIRANGTEMPYNDLDFTLVVAGKFKVPWHKLQAISALYASELNIEVDFSRPLTLRDVQHWPHWLMWYDLLNGHVTLKGSPNILIQHAPATLRTPLPAIEATRLLLNRGAGLLWALRISRGIEAAPDEDFVRRNYYKCALAMGDALLITYQRYTTKYLGRDDLLANLEQDEPEVRGFGLQSLYRDALRFKFRPDHVSSDSIPDQELRMIAEAWGSVFLQVERVRTGTAWASLQDYVDWNGIREKDQHSVSKLFRNVTRNFQLGLWDWRYPREALYRDLPVLLDLVQSKARNWAQESKRFLRVWKRFN
jgi:hypothetical protein